jgi:DUF4097 and DUF4098 domain-containing protein YvlB
MTRTPFAAAALLLAGCTFNVGWPGPGVESAPETREIAVGEARALEITAESGDIRVDGSPSAGVVKVTAVRRAPATADLDRISWTAAVEGDAVRVGYTVTGSREGCGVSFSVEAPAAFRLKLRSAAGSIRARGFAAGMDARTEAGNVHATDVTGDLELRTDAGNIGVAGASGTVRAGTDAGNVHVAGSLRGACELSTDAGNVEAVLPAGSRLKVSARTSAGSVSTDFPLVVEGRIVARGVNGTLGDGADGTLTLKSDAGNVSLRRAP